MTEKSHNYFINKKKSHNLTTRLWLPIFFELKKNYNWLHIFFFYQIIGSISLTCFRGEIVCVRLPVVIYPFFHFLVGPLNGAKKMKEENHRRYNVIVCGM